MLFLSKLTQTLVHTWLDLFGKLEGEMVSSLGFDKRRRGQT